MPEKEAMSEDQAWEIALNDHPEFRKALEKGTLPEEMTDENGDLMNPRLHLTLHAIVERQIATDDPPGVAAIARQLEKLRVPPHEIRHAIARPVSEEMWHMMKEGHVFDEQKYLKELGEIVRSYR